MKPGDIKYNQRKKHLYFTNNLTKIFFSNRNIESLIENPFCDFD